MYGGCEKYTNYRLLGTEAVYRDLMFLIFLNSIWVNTNNIPWLLSICIYYIKKTHNPE